MPTSKAIVPVTDKSVLTAYSSDEGLDSVVLDVHKVVDEFEYDLETAKGRSAIASLAGKISTIKVRLDDLGKGLTTDWKEKSKAVDSSRRRMREDLEELRVTARKPLTDWENAEKLRIANLAEQVETFTEYGEHALEEWEQMSVENLKFNLGVCESAVIDESWQEFANRGAIAKEEAIRKISRAIEFAENRDVIQAKEEAEIAEAEAKEKLEREETIKREAREQAEAVAKQEAEKVKREAEEKEQRLIDEKIESEAKAKKAEEDKIVAEAEAKLLEKQAIKAKAQAEKDAKVKAEQAVEEEKKRVADADAKVVEEQAKRDRNTANVGRIRKQAKEALMKWVDEDTARKIVLAINADQIPNVKITY